MKNLPNDPIMLLSVVNTQLRDKYSDLESLCEDLNVDREKLIEKLKVVDYLYDSKLNQFR